MLLVIIKITISLTLCYFPVLGIRGNIIQWVNPVYILISRNIEMDGVLEEGKQ
jgi:hypothetical protein